MNILLINPGRREYLVKYFLDLSTKYKSKIFIIDSNKFIPSFLVSKETRNFVSPKCRKKSNFQHFLRNFVKKNKIKISVNKFNYLRSNNKKLIDPRRW